VMEQQCHRRVGREHVLSGQQPVGHARTCRLPNRPIMELVGGPTLAGRIAAGTIPLGEALPIASRSTSVSTSGRSAACCSRC
jgi:hypothetical protein